MKSFTEKELTDLLVNWVRANHVNHRGSKLSIDSETNLLESGLLDSLGFVDLVLYLEGQCGIKIDLTDAAPEEFTVVKGLCQIALKGGRQQTQPQT